MGRAARGVLVQEKERDKEDCLRYGKGDTSTKKVARRGRGELLKEGVGKKMNLEGSSLAYALAACEKKASGYGKKKGGRGAWGNRWYETRMTMNK